MSVIDDSAAINLLRERLRNGTHEEILSFLQGHATATVAAHLISSMTPEVRSVFILQIKGIYPEAFPDCIICKRMCEGN